MGLRSHSAKHDARLDGRKGRLAVAATVIGFLAVLASGAGQAGAQDVGTLQSRISGAREQAQGLAADIDSKTSELASVRARAAAAAQREQQLAGLLAQGQEREAELSQKVSEAQTKLAAAKARLRRALEALSDRLVAIYKGDVPDVATLLLDSNGFDDLATRADYLKRIEDADADLAARVRSLRDAVETQLAAVSKARDAAAAYNDRIESAHAQIDAARAEAESQAAALADARAAQAASLGELRSQVGGWEQQVQHLQSVSAAQAQQQVADWVGDWAIPESIVMCESGGNFGAVNPSSGAGGAYQILPSTWSAYGGHGSPQSASPSEQSRIAAQIWADSGSSAWACAG
jgi:peptidoglycan hydrolase CwlO-like protein